MRTILVTGASRGIGAAVATMAGARGYAVAVNYERNAAAAEAVVRTIREGGGTAAAFQADMGREDAARALFDSVAEAFGPVTALVNNAGIVGPYGRFDAAPMDEIRRMVEINVMGVLVCCQEAVRRMSTRHGGPGGAIVNVSSMATTLGAPNEFIGYAATKGAVDSFTIGLAREVAKEGIRVNAVRPGLIDTDIQQIPGGGSRLDTLASSPPAGRPGTADEVAESILWLLSDAASYVTGSMLNVSGGR